MLALRLEETLRLLLRDDTRARMLLDLLLLAVGVEGAQEVYFVKARIVQVVVDEAEELAALQ